ncbi:MAG: PD-(D/E)XK motif protein [Firmicutes bacterium]|nr:PD-(D/E)XK motif protein [Bacillota bacterium]
MDIKKLYEDILLVSKSNSDSYSVIERIGCYYGLDKNGNIVFITKSANPSARSIAQQTKQLYLGQNIACSITISGATQRDFFDVIICFDKTHVTALNFLHLTQVYIGATKTANASIVSFFDSLKNLFANKKQIPLSEMQGLYGELYFIHLMNDSSIDISSYWQSHERMKFDFSVDAVRKIEVKTTTNEGRVHKFRHEQLVSDIYDIWIVSFILRRDDKGLSIQELADTVMRNNPTNLQLHTYVTRLLNNYSADELQSICFNEQFTKTNVRFYNTKDVPHFPGRQPDGVSNTEYDSDLSSISFQPFEELVKWVK